jgi:hypothetical protein
MGDDPMALLGLEGALKHYYYYYVVHGCAAWMCSMDVQHDGLGGAVRVEMYVCQLQRACTNVAPQGLACKRALAEQGAIAVYVLVHLVVYTHECTLHM